MIYGAATGTCPAPVGAKSTGCDATLTEAWIATVKRLRNFPSVFDYAMDVSAAVCLLTLCLHTYTSLTHGWMCVSVCVLQNEDIK
jgi:hypothetical protein